MEGFISLIEDFDILLCINSQRVLEISSLLNFYFKTENKSFNLQENLKALPSGYNTCKKNDKNCQFTIDENIYVKKKFGKYIFYKK